VQHLLILILLIFSVLGHYIPFNIDMCFNLYPATKHGSVALTHVVRQELAEIKASIRITVSYDRILIIYFLLFFISMLCK
jgi:hypothetical protein